MIKYPKKKIIPSLINNLKLCFWNCLFWIWEDVMLNQLQHLHDYKVKGNYEVCHCGKRKLILRESKDEGRLLGKREDGQIYSVREHRMSWFMPDLWLKLIENLRSSKARRTAQVLIQTGSRINESRNIEKRDIDWERNTVKLRITKCKAKKKERKGKPRTIPISSQFTRQLKKFFKKGDDNKSINLLSTSAFNLALKKALKEINDPSNPYYMFSAHNIRKTHGNWLKIMGNLRIMNVDPAEICLRLGHDYNTFLKDYGSSGVFGNKDVFTVKKILGDLYQR